jgi:general secretion pathway protein D
MKKLSTVSLLSCALASWSLLADIMPVEDSRITSSIKKEDPAANEKLISFRFNQAPLLDIISMLAEEKGLNIVIPAGQQTITEKVTFEIPQKITIEEAWERLLSFLRICGYSVIFQKEFVSIVKNDPKETSRQPFPLYVHTGVDLIPDTDEKIRYLYYFYNLQVNGDSSNGSVVDILQAFLSKDATILIDETINGVIITDGARHISSTITLLKELDERMSGNEGKEVLPLKHTVATSIAGYLQTIINPSGKQTIADIGAPSVSQYFSKNIRIIPEPRTNSLILLGKKEPLARIKLFIQEFIDIKLDAGESILHIYDLQYLDAATFKQTLSNILVSQSASSQSSGSSIESAGQQYFKDVKVIAEATQAINPASLQSVSSNAPPTNNQAGNRLIIAARRDDWLRIERLIKDLDKPQLQVAIEVLIVDLTIEEDKALGAQLRNLSTLGSGYPSNINFQTSHLGGNNNGAIILNAGTATSGNQLQANLLQSTGVDALGNEENMASAFAAGSLVLSFKDPNTNGMWLVTQMLNTYQDVKILSQPFVIALNNQSCSFNSSESRLLTGGSSVIPGGGGVQSYKENVKATLGVQLTPMISRDMRINLAIDVNITEYQDTNSSVILNRKMHTNVNIKDGEILVLGGLTKTTLTKSERNTPILSQIPIIGNLFKSKENTKAKDNLIVFIAPRIIVPRKTGRFDPYTAAKITNVNALFENKNTESLKDPITHWFFGTDEDEIAVQKVKMLGKKDLFDETIIDDEKYHSTSKIIIINKHEELPKDSIKSSPQLIPSPDKTHTGMTKLIVRLPVKENADSMDKTKDDNLLNEEILIGGSLDQKADGKKRPIKKEQDINKTKTGMPKLVVTVPKKITPAAGKKVGDIFKEQDQLKSEDTEPDTEDANLKKLASQLKKSQF